MEWQNFRNFCRQELQLPFFSARASSERIIYVIDRRVPASTRPGASGPPPSAAKAGFGAALAAAPPAAPQQPPTTRALFSPVAFDGLTQWGLLCIVYVMSFETLRLGGRVAAATRVEHVTRLVFLLAVAATAGCAVLYGQN